MNFDAGRVRSMTGPSAVKVRTPVASSARSVDCSAWVRPGVCPGGLPEAAPQTQPSMIGWIVAEAAGAPLRMSAAAINIARTKRLMVTPLREWDTQPHPGETFIHQPAGPRIVCGRQAPFLRLVPQAAHGCTRQARLPLH